MRPEEILKLKKKAQKDTSPSRNVELIETSLIKSIEDKKRNIKKVKAGSALMTRSLGKSTIKNEKILKI